MARRAKKGEAAFLNQCTVLAAKWDTIDPASIGLSEQFVGSFDEKTRAARDAAAAARAAQDALASAMLRKQIVLDALRASFGAATGQIDAHAKATGDVNVYPRAGIPRPEKRSKRPAPPTPRRLEARPLTYGPVELRFESSGEGVLYEIQRSVTPIDGRPGPWEPVAIAGHHRVRDRRVPRGVESIHYRVRARRSTGRVSHWSSAAQVSFGCDRPCEAEVVSGRGGRGVAA
ncbi:MAG: hypothetical protein RIB58_11980 [Phycisphaerales bacterium]|jgi:hypothetical protein